MTIAGTGVLAFWHDVAPGGEAEFDQWHLREHIPERVAVPGFLRCRRYVTLGAPPRGERARGHGRGDRDARARATRGARGRAPVVADRHSAPRRRRAPGRH